MPKKRSGDIHAIVQNFVARLSSLIEEDAVTRARAAVLSAFGVGGKTGGRGAAGRLVSADSSALRRQRRKGPIQLCPVPGCKNRAAPVFGMVCADHKGLPKATIKKYREQRRARKAAGKK
jgi:hypothetical protein